MLRLALFRYRGSGTCFVASCAVLLALIGLAKLISSLGEAEILKVADPILGLRNRHVLFLAGGIEVGICLTLIMWGGSIVQKALIIFWFGVAIVGYRVVFWILGIQAPCRCLGTLTDALPISETGINSIMLLALAYFVFGSGFIIARHVGLCPRQRGGSVPRLQLR